MPSDVAILEKEIAARWFASAEDMTGNRGRTPAARGNDCVLAIGPNSSGRELHVHEQWSVLEIGAEFLFASPTAEALAVVSPAGGVGIAVGQIKVTAECASLF